MPQAGQEATSTDKPITECPKNMSEAGYRCMCLSARSIVNKKNGSNIQAYEIKLESEADYDEAVWCKIVSGNSKLTI